MPRKQHQDSGYRTPSQDCSHEIHDVVLTARIYTPAAGIRLAGVCSGGLASFSFRDASCTCPAIPFTIIGVTSSTSTLGGQITGSDVGKRIRFFIAEQEELNRIARFILSPSDTGIFFPATESDA
jgi:hypothetical protein